MGRTISPRQKHILLDRVLFIHWIPIVLLSSFFIGIWTKTTNDDGVAGADYLVISLLWRKIPQLAQVTLFLKRLRKSKHTFLTALCPYKTVGELQLLTNPYIIRTSSPTVGCYPEKVGISFTRMMRGLPKVTQSTNDVFTPESSLSNLQVKWKCINIYEALSPL